MSGTQGMMPPMRRTTVLVVAPWTWFHVRDLTVLMELVAVVLPLLLAGCIGLLVARRLLVPAASLVVFSLVVVAGPWIPRDLGHPADGVTIAVANVLQDNVHPEDVVEDILRQDADVVVVPEATLEIHRLLEQHFHWALRAYRFDASIGVYGHIPVRMPEDVRGPLAVTRQLRAVVEGPDGEFVLWAVHLPKPWFVATGGYQLRPGAHARAIDGVLDRVAQEAEPVVLAGDTNLTDRGRGYRKLTAHLDDALRTTWGGPTARKWYLRPLLLRIDHVLVPKDWCADHGHRFALTGSDHRGVRVRVGPCD
jgi:endonuclease/exonuclease/phosphatase (EEP) superfamily protein YafD